MTTERINQDSNELQLPAVTGLPELALVHHVAVPGAEEYDESIATVPPINLANPPQLHLAEAAEAEAAHYAAEPEADKPPLAPPSKRGLRSSGLREIVSFQPLEDIDLRTSRIADITRRVHKARRTLGRVSFSR